MKVHFATDSAYDITVLLTERESDALRMVAGAVAGMDVQRFYERMGLAYKGDRPSGPEIAAVLHSLCRMLPPWRLEEDSK